MTSTTKESTQKPQGLVPPTDGKRSAPKSPFNPYDLIIVGVDDLAPFGVAADSKADPDRGVTAAQAERRRKLYTQLFDERAMLPMPEEKIAVAREFGIQAPVHYIVFEGNAYLVDGRQRVKAARAVWSEQEDAQVLPEQRITVPGIPYKGDIETLFAASRVLNVHTEETPMMRARSMSRLLMEEVKDGDKTRKRTTQEVAVIYGVSDQTVRNSLKLFESSDTVKKALVDLKQPTIGLLIADLPEEQQVKVLDELKADQRGGAKVTVDRARVKVQAAKGKVVNSPKDKVETIQREIQKLADKAMEAACTNCKDLAEHKQANVLLLKALDAIARAAFGGGKIAFPTPIKDQKPGYTLDVIAKTGD